MAASPAAAARAIPTTRGFALRALALLGRLSDPTARRAGEFLASCLDRPLSGPDCTSLLGGLVLLDAAGVDRQRIVRDVFEPLRRGDGGYAKTARGGQSGTYQTFLAAMCREMAGLPLGRSGGGRGPDPPPPQAGRRFRRVRRDVAPAESIRRPPPWRFSALATPWTSRRGPRPSASSPRCRPATAVSAPMAGSRRAIC